MFKSSFQIKSPLYIILTNENENMHQDHLRSSPSLSSIHIWRHPLGQRQTQQDKRLCLRDSCLSEAPPSQPLLYSGGCYREGRWLITINRTERERERAHRPTGPYSPKPRKWEAVARREERQLYGNTKLIPPSDLISLPPPCSPLWGPSFESAGCGQMVDGPHRLYSWTQATVTQSDLAGLNHTSSCPTYEEPGQKVLKPRPWAKNRSTLVAHRKCVAAQ